MVDELFRGSKSCPQNMKVLKEKTQSLCPVCREANPARIVADDGGVFLEHQCPRHGTRQVQVERDTEFYVTVMTRLQNKPNLPPYLTVFPTYRCNINCNVCYVPRRDPAMDMSPDEISAILDRWPYPDVFFAGGEPTVMENLPQIMALTRAKGKWPYIVTNGIRLADARYVAELARSGLQGVWLSLNALDGNTLEATDGKNHLDAKLRAVSNLKRHMRRFAVCFSLVRGVNEGEFGKVLRFALRQYPFARSFHAECLPGIGRSINYEGVFLSEMLGLLAQHAGVARLRLLELAAQGKAEVGPYGFDADYRDLGARTSGLLSSSAMALTKMVGSRWPDMRVRVIAGPLPDTVDLEETWSATTTMAVSKENPVMPLWEYLIRYHGGQRQQA